MASAGRFGAGFGVGLGCVVATPCARADELAHALQLSLDGTLFSYQSDSVTPDDKTAPAFGSAAPNTTDTASSFSLLGTGFGVRARTSS